MIVIGGQIRASAVPIEGLHIGHNIKRIHLSRTNEHLKIPHPSSIAIVISGASAPRISLGELRSNRPKKTKIRQRPNRKRHFQSNSPIQNQQLKLYVGETPP
jgi:hypothetical protein